MGGEILGQHSGAKYTVKNRNPSIVGLQCRFHALSIILPRQNSRCLYTRTVVVMPRSIVGQILGEGMKARNARQLEKPPDVEALHLAINAFLEHLEHGDAVHAGAYEAYETGSAQGGEQAKQAFFAALANSDHPPRSRLPVLSQFLLHEWNFVRRPISEVPAYRFLESVPSVADGMLAPEDAVCAICFQSYGTSASGEEDDESYAVKLPCCSQHIGLDCIETVSNVPKTCPLSSMWMNHKPHMKVHPGVRSRATLTYTRNLVVGSVRGTRKERLPLLPNRVLSSATPYRHHRGITEHDGRLQQSLLGWRSCILG